MVTADGLNVYFDADEIVTWQYNYVCVSFRQRALGRRIRRAAKAKLKRELQKLQDQLRKVEQRAEKHSFQWLKKDNSAPKSKVNKLVQQISGTSLRRTLLFHTAVAEEVRNKYAQSKRESDRQIIAEIVTSKILKYFSENYNCKYSTEVQAVHFGASHQQATLHTGVY